MPTANQLRRTYALAERDDAGQPTGRVEIRTTMDEGQRSAAVVVAVLDRSEALDLVGDLAQALRQSAP